MTDGIAAGTLFVFFRSRTGASTSIATIGIDLPEGSQNEANYRGWAPMLFGDWLITLGVYLIGADTGQSGRGVNAHFVLSRPQTPTLGCSAKGSARRPSSVTWAI
jgi:hypothetical protein